MPPAGVKKGTKRARQYEHIKQSEKSQGQSLHRVRIACMVRSDGALLSQCTVTRVMSSWSKSRKFEVCSPSTARVGP